MGKNLIYIVTIDHPSSTYKNSSYSQYCLNTWKYWCEKNNVDLQVITEHDERFGKPIWNKELIYERAEGYDKIGLVDSDTMVKWDSPNPFDLFDEDFCGVNDIANMKWMDDSIKAYGKFFPNLEIDYYQYINAGVLFFHKKHLHIFKEILDFYFDNQEELDNWNKGGGKEQTILNFHLVKNSIKPKLISPSWNLFSMHKKEMLQGNWQIQEDPTPFFVKYGNIWHFTGISVQDRIELMRITWERFGAKYV